MSGGAAGLAGYVYQQDYVSFRVLASVALGRGPSLLPVQRVDSYAIEARNVADGPAWDVRLSLSNPTSIELRECKDTQISGEDRRIFYRRVRRECNAGTAPDDLTIGWVTDEAKQGKLIDHLAEMSRLACRVEVPKLRTQPARVDSGESALQEALYWLCFDDSRGAQQPLEIEAARGLLSRIRVDKTSSDNLREAVEILVGEALTQGTGPALRQMLIGKLTDGIVRAGFAAGTVEELLATAAGDCIYARVRGELRKFLDRYSALAPLPEAPEIIWERMPGRPFAWPLISRLPEFDGDRSCVIVGPQGAGKSTLCIQAFREQAGLRDRHHTFLLDVGRLEPGFVRHLPGFMAVLCGLAPTWIAIDGLDRIGIARSRDWEDCLARLLKIPRLTLMATVREEVLTSGEWFQRVTTPLRTLRLGLLGDEEVREAFDHAKLAAPTAPDLLRVLRNPLLLSLYARIADPHSLSLGAGGRITGFQVVHAFWERRVLTPSEGHRSEGPKGASPSAKQKAIEHLTDRTLEGSLSMKLADAANPARRGIRMLINEGIVVRNGTHAVWWYHDWIREYALIDRLIAGAESPGPGSLARAVRRASSDHVARTAAVAGAKWAIAFPAWGPVELYLAALHESKPGHASEALAALLEESPVHLDLAALTDPLLVEAIEMARQMGAWGWSERIALLPSTRFQGPEKTRLTNAVIRYELDPERPFDD